MSLDPPSLSVEPERDDERAAYTRIAALAARLAGTAVAVLCLRRGAASATAFSVGLADDLPDATAADLAAFSAALAPETGACVVPAPAPFAAAGLTSVAVAPLTLADGQNAGALWVADRYPDRWDAQALDDVAACAAVAADRAWLAYAAARDITARRQAEEALRQYAVDLMTLHLLEQQARQLAETLRTINGTLTQSLRLETVIETILRAIQQLIPEANAQITLLHASVPEVYRLTGGGALEHGAPDERWEALGGRHEPPESAVGGSGPSSATQRRQAAEGGQAIDRIDIPLATEGDLIGAFTVMAAGEAGLTTGQRQLVETVAEQASVALQNATLFAEVQRSRAQLQILSHQLIHAQDDERRGIARELHDEIGQGLVALQLSLGAASTTDERDQIAARLLDCRTLVEGLIVQVRSLSRELRPALLDDLGLAPALSWYLEQLAERSGLRITLSATIDDLKLSPAITIACFRIVQEALNNVVRHARAARVWVDLRHTDGQLHLAVTDDGLGFEVEAISSRAAHGASLGLLNMRERALLVHGTLELTSAPGAGTRVQVKIRLPNSD